eukprot:159874-Rhodomonas_salina.4
MAGWPWSKCLPFSSACLLCAWPCAPSALAPGAEVCKPVPPENRIASGSTGTPTATSAPPSSSDAPVRDTLFAPSPSNRCAVVEAGSDPTTPAVDPSDL